MRKNSSLRWPVAGTRWREPKFVVRVILGVLLAATMVAAGILLFPPGGSAEDLDRQLTNLQAQAKTQRARLILTKEHAAAVEKGRTQGDKFLDEYFMARRTASSTVLSTLEKASTVSKVTSRERSYNFEKVDGSDTLLMMTITANYEGVYSDLLHLVHEIDRSPRLLIIESLNAAPQQGTGKLTVSMKLETFVREDGSGAGDINLGGGGKAEASAVMVTRPTGSGAGQ